MKQLQDPWNFVIQFVVTKKIFILEKRWIFSVEWNEDLYKLISEVP